MDIRSSLGGSERLFSPKKGYWPRHIRYTRKSMYFQYLIFSIVLLIVALTLPYAQIIMFCMLSIYTPYASWKYARLYAKENPQCPSTMPKDFWRHFYENGKLKREGRLKNGKNDGLWKGYYENGELMEEGNFKIGKKVGSWKYYNQEGQLKTKYYSLK